MKNTSLFEARGKVFTENEIREALGNTDPRTASWLVGFYADGLCIYDLRTYMDARKVTTADELVNQLSNEGAEIFTPDSITGGFVKKCIINHMNFC